MKYLRTCQQWKIPNEVGNDKDIILDKGSTADSGVETLWPTDTIGIVRSPVSPNILDLAVNRYGFDNPILTEKRMVGKLMWATMVMITAMLLWTMKNWKTYSL